MDPIPSGQYALSPKCKMNVLCYLLWSNKHFNSAVTASSLTVRYNIDEAKSFQSKWMFVRFFTAHENFLLTSSSSLKMNSHPDFWEDTVCKNKNVKPNSIKYLCMIQTVGD